MEEMMDENQDLLRDAIEHVKRCASWTELTETQQERLVIEYIRKRVACPLPVDKGNRTPDD